jgi:hypothetical protein
MACSIGAAVRRQVTVRPVLVRVIRPASHSTSRCFITAGSDISKGFANSLIVTLSRPSRCASNARRVGSATAENVRLN